MTILDIEKNYEAGTNSWITGINNRGRQVTLKVKVRRMPATIDLKRLYFVANGKKCRIVATREGYSFRFDLENMATGRIILRGIA